MMRLLICLPICLLLVPSYPNLAVSLDDPAPPYVQGKHVLSLEPLLMLGTHPEASFPGNIPWMSLGLLAQRSAAPKQALALLAFNPSAGFPGVYNWTALHLMTNSQAGIDLVRPDGDPVAFLAKSLERYDRDVRCYTMTMRKTEKIGGKLQPTEIVEVKFREKPFSVYFRWLEGARSASRTLYVFGENEGRMLTLTALGVLKLDVDSPLVKSSSRYPITEFGFKKATERVFRGWKEAQVAGTLHVEYLGLQKKAEIGDQWCHVLRRTKYTKPPEDGVEDLMLFFDRDTWLQVGSELRDKKGHLIGEYYFREVRLNPDLPPAQFEPAVLKK